MSRPALTKDLVDQITNKKMSSRLISRLYWASGKENHAKNVMECCDEAFLTDEGKFWKTNFCKDKWCPMCQWKKTRFIFHRVMEIVKDMEKVYGFAFLTLTVPNVPGAELSDTLDRMKKAYRVFMGAAGAKYGKGRGFQAFKGSMQSIEITYNQDTDTYHPHIHALVALPKAYFDRKRNHNIYVTKEQIWERWGECYPGAESVKWQAISTKKINQEGMDETIDFPAAVAEIAKYPFKMADLYQMDKEGNDMIFEVFDTIQKALFRRPLYRFFGIMKTVSAKLTDKEEYLLSFIQLIEGDSFVNVHRFIASIYTDRLTYYESWRLSYGNEPFVFCDPFMYSRYSLYAVGMDTDLYNSS